MNTLQDIDNYAVKNSLPYVLIGGHAVNSYGFSRQTGDLDVMAKIDDKPAWRKFFISLGYQIFHETDAFLQLSPSASLVWPVDIMFVDKATIEGVLAESCQAEIEPGKAYPVPSPQHLIAMKLHAMKEAGKIRDLKDIADIIELLRHINSNPNDEDIKELCLKYGGQAVYEKIRTFWN